MSDETQITRRASLRGIAATGAIIGSTGLTASTVSASEKKVDAAKNVYFKGCHAVAVHLEDDHDEVPIRIRVYDDETDRFENIERTITDEHLLPYPIWEQLPDDYDEKDDHGKKNDDEDGYEDDEADKKKDRKKKDDHEDDKKDELPEWICEDDVEPPKGHKPDDDGKRVWVFNIHQFYDHGIDTDNEIISVEIGDKRIENPNCEEKHRPEYDKKGDVDVDEIGLVAICFDSKRNTARFRVDNDNKKSVTVEYDVYNTDQDGEVTVEPQSTTYFDVEATGSEGQATVRLFYDDDQIDVKASNTQRECADDVTVYSSALDLADEQVQFTVSDNADYDRMFSYYVAETGETGTITVPGDDVSLASFWVHAPYGHASVTLYHHGIVVGKAERKPDLSGPVVNVDQGESYETIQAAVDDANEGETIVVCEDEELDDTVNVDVADLTIRGFHKPTVDGNGNSPVFNIVADGVTIGDLGVTNPDELLGIRVGVGVDGATIKNNHIFEIGPTGNLGVTGIIVGQGNHDDIEIYGNTIEDLEQTDDGSFATLNGILFDADNEDPGTITNVEVSDNDIRDLESTTAPLGIVVQHNAESVTIEENHVEELTADNDFGPGSFTTFAQGISIDSPSTDDFDIEDNTIEKVVSNDGFFGEDIKIEPGADVSGIEIHENNLLSAIGLNNANGNNPEVEAEDNFWNDDDGPFVIENNADDGDVPVPGGGEVDLDTVDASAVTENVDFNPAASSSQ